MPMAGPFAYLAEFRRPALALTAAAVLAFPLAAQAQGRGPDKIADVAEAVIDAVVNISTSQTVTAGGPTPRQGPGQGPGQNPEARPGPQLPPGSPFEEFFEEFFKNRRGVSPPFGSPWPRRFLKNSSKNSSNGEPGGRFGPGRASGPCPGPWRDDGPPAVTVCEVEMLTTASITASATSAMLSGPRAAWAAPNGKAIAAAAAIASAPLRTLGKVTAMGVESSNARFGGTVPLARTGRKGRIARLLLRGFWGGNGAEPDTASGGYSRPAFCMPSRKRSISSAVW